ncbi:MAG: hypothetical protein Q8Q62_16560 [Mesorhizobium sp.]|nr:hypothetical protein [Mesorhizobium sp.]
MKTVLIALGLTATMAVAGCTSTERDVGVGAVAGAAIGGLATGRVGGAVAGAVIGGAAGALLGRAARRGECRYRDNYGRVYIARCPRGYY